MNIAGFRSLVSIGVNVPSFIVGAMTKYRSRAFEVLREYFGKERRLSLFVEQRGKGRWVENLKIQDAMLQGEFCEKRFGVEAVLYTEYVPLDWRLEVTLYHDGGGIADKFSGVGEKVEVINFSYVEGIEDVCCRSLCRIAESLTNLLELSSQSVGIYVDIGWSSGFFGTRGEREFVRDFQLLTK